MVKVGDAEKFFRVLGFKGLDPFLTVNKHGPRFKATEEDGSNNRLVQLNLLVKLMMLRLLIPFSLAIAAIAEAILVRASAE